MTVIRAAFLCPHLKLREGPARDWGSSQALGTQLLKQSCQLFISFVIKMAEGPELGRTLEEVGERMGRREGRVCQPKDFKSS